MNELPTRPGKTILRAKEAEAWLDGYAFLERVRQHADEVETEARRTAAKAYAEGFEEGRREGEAQATELLTRTTRRVERYLSGLDQSMADLCLQMVRRILGEFDDTELISRCVRQALREYRHDMAVTVRVAPERMSEVESLLAAGEESGQPPCRVESDTQLKADQCLLVSPVAVVDVGLDAQLNALRRALAVKSETSP
ncbi:type III secretion system stator protein SctL [Litchfieldella rifensis]|uniref:Type 3 secretion system stator protein n=1 Tax=Litchfieldella rifensis TaxID=762643 RepID=A0ABV7LJ76_9GAMM